MKTFNQDNKEISNNPYMARVQSSLPPHFHSNLEIYVLKKGKLSINVNGENFKLNDGEICIVDSYEIHGADECGLMDVKALTVPFRLLSSFNAKRKNMAITNRIIKNQALCEELYTLIERYIDSERSVEIKESATEFILSIISNELVFGESKYGEESGLIRKILTYLHANFKGGASLKEVALALGYTEAHLSRVFHKYVKTNLSQYVNMLRYEAVEESLLKNPNKRRIDAIYEAGFKSQQTYYRFKNTLI